jgi:hypothetical protein
MVLITDGPYLETKEHIGSFWVLEATDDRSACRRRRLYEVSAARIWRMAPK